ncbi:MAG: LOG family protein [Candidatus Roizmanbacteria bacterium]
MNNIKNVTFFGCASVSAGGPTYDSAKEVAKLVAQSGRTVVNGGGPGVMLAATLGAKEAGGKTIAVYYTPSSATHFEGKTGLNYADETYEEANYVVRTKKLLELGDLYIVFNGGTGTISELGMAWGVARLYHGHHKPLILFGDFWHNIMDTFKNYMMVRPEEYEVFTIISDPKEVVPLIEKYDNLINTNGHKKLPDNDPEKSLFL